VVDVAGVEPRSPHLVLVTLAGPELEGFDIGLPASSVRLLLPDEGHGLVIPTWNGNEFLFDDGRRPPIRTLTPRRFDPDRSALDVEIVLHGDAPLSRWAEGASVGDRVAVSGTGRGYEVDPEAGSFLLAGDASALPAISVLLESIAAEATVQVLVEVRHADARVELPDHPGATVSWFELEPGAPPGDALVTAVTDAAVETDTRVWAAGEAAAMHRIRRHLADDRHVPRSHAVVRGYWKVERN
jgi:NADPH-dependent ferric siderophore reductase